MNLRPVTTGGLVLLLAGCAAAITPPRAVPPALHPGTDATLVLTTAARGVQIYECRGGSWTFVAPQAELFDSAGRIVGTHGAGPFWQASDGSRVVAGVQARADAPAAGAIPWLLLAARPDAADRGVLSGVTRIQRVNTAGGSAPSGPCDTPGRPLHVPYSADYHFYRSQP